MRTARPAPQQPSGMPFGKYVPFLDVVDTDLPDRTWPTRRITRAPRWLTTDLRDGNHCIKATALAALRRGLGVTVNTRAVVSRNPGAFERTKRRLSDAGVRLVAD